MQIIEIQVLQNGSRPDWTRERPINERHHHYQYHGWMVIENTNNYSAVSPLF